MTRRAIAVLFLALALTPAAMAGPKEFTLIQSGYDPVWGLPFSFRGNSFGYSPVVRITSSDPNAVLPADYDFKFSNGGSHNFSITFYSLGTQTITMTDVDDPTIHATMTVFVPCHQIFVEASNSGPSCGGSVQLAATSTPSNTGVSFTWTGPNGFTSTERNPTVNQTGLYEVTATREGACPATARTHVAIDEPPSVEIAGPEVVCPGSTGNSASVAGAAASTYAWTIANGTITSGEGTNAITFSAADGAVTLGVTVTRAGCTSVSDTLTIDAPPAPAAVLPEKIAACAGTVAVPVALSGVGPWTLVWSDGVVQSNVASSTTERTIEVSESTTLSITSVTSACGTGGGSDPVAIEIAPPVIIADQPKTQIVARGARATFTVDATGDDVHYVWFCTDCGDGLTAVGMDSPTFTTEPVTTRMTFFVRVYDGCSVIDSHRVQAVPAGRRRAVRR